MTTPDVPLRLELAFEIPGTPRQVWDAIATANGISSWFLPTELEERVGGTIVTHMGEEASSSGTVTDLDAPRHFAYVEPGPGGAGRPCRRRGHPAHHRVRRRGAIGGHLRGPRREQRLRHWCRLGGRALHRHGEELDAVLRLYLTHFPGQRVTSLSAEAVVPGARETVWSDLELLLRLSDPLPGFLQFAAMDLGDGSTWAQLEGYLFSEDAPRYVERERPAWKAWIESLAVSGR